MASWPKATDPADENATALNTLPKYVASRTLDKVTWNNSHLLKGTVTEEVQKLKAQDGGEIQVHGSGDLLQTLLRQDLIDALRIWSFPVVLGTGKRLFGEGTIPRAFRLVETQQTATGAVLHLYEDDVRNSLVSMTPRPRDAGADNAVRSPDTQPAKLAVSVGSGRPRRTARCAEVERAQACRTLSSAIPHHRHCVADAVRP